MFRVNSSWRLIEFVWTQILCASVFLSVMAETVVSEDANLGQSGPLFPQPIQDLDTAEFHLAHIILNKAVKTIYKAGAIVGHHNDYYHHYDPNYDRYYDRHYNPYYDRYYY